MSEAEREEKCECRDIPSEAAEGHCENADHTRGVRSNSNFYSSLKPSASLKLLSQQVWRAFEELSAQGKVGLLGISNCYDPETFEALFAAAAVKPRVLQNRFYPESGWVPIHATQFSTQSRSLCYLEHVSLNCLELLGRWQREWGFWTCLPSFPTLQLAHLNRSAAPPPDATVANYLGMTAVCGNSAPPTASPTRASGR